MPVTITHLGGAASRVHDVGEQDRGENTIIGDLGLVAGEELGDLMERLPPRFYEVVHVAARQLDVIGVRYAAGNVFASDRGCNHIVSVTDDERWDADCGKHRSCVQF